MARLTDEEMVAIAKNLLYSRIPRGGGMGEAIPGSTHGSTPLSKAEHVREKHGHKLN